MSILSLIEQTGNHYKKKATTRGGEYSGPCPWCGGNDRFSIHPEQDHFVCRQCRKAGDSITFMMQYHGMTYRAACTELNIIPKYTDRLLDTANEKPGQNELIWQPREVTEPPIIWQDKAEAFLFEAYKHLLSPAGKIHRDWLNNRGISNSTIKHARMGWNISSVSFDRESWGLPLETDQNGKNKQIWIPAGLIIPLFKDGKPVRLRIRQANPDAADRFIMVPGSAMGFFDYTAHQDQAPDLEKPVIITEAELDGWLLQEKLGDLFQVFAIGNASARPDKQTHDQLKHAKIILNLDDDPAGHAEQSWWHNQYPDCLTWYSDFGKDPGESFEVGVDIRQWGKDGLQKLLDQNRDQSEIKSKPSKPAIQKFKEKIIEKYPQDKSGDGDGGEENKQQIQKQTQTQNSSTIPPTMACVHGLFCTALKDKICLINKQNPWHTLKCPKEQWYTYAHPNGIITEIILGVGVRKK